MSPGERHFARNNFGAFDMLYVINGCLSVGEDNVEYDILPGHALVLRPDAYHYGSMPCKERTEYIWMHFLTTGAWDTSIPNLNNTLEEHQDTVFSPSETQYFHIHIPNFCKLKHPDHMLELLRQQIENQQLEQSSLIRWKQQTLLQEVLMQLAASEQHEAKSLAMQCAEHAAAYLRRHYRDEVTAPDLGEAINFHPVYIARCMKQHLGVSPMQYLHNYRLERAKLLLIQSDMAILRIAEEVGYQSAAYFTSSFTKYTGLSPRLYRQNYR